VKVKIKFRREFLKVFMFGKFLLVKTFLGKMQVKKSINKKELILIKNII
jgi:hypothetical protein